MSLSKFYSLLAGVMAVVTLWMAGCTTPTRNYVSVEGEALGTFVQVKCNTTLSADDIEAAIEAIDGEMKASMSIFDEESRLSRINNNLTDSLDSHIRFNLTLAARFNELSDGYYDVTVKPLTAAWGFAQKSEERQNPNIDSLIEFVGFSKIAIHGDVVRKSDPRVQLDFNSIAKGYVVDLLAERLEGLGIDNYMVNIGGEIR